MRDWQRTINNDTEFEKTWEQLVRLKDKVALRGVLKPFQITIEEVKKSPSNPMRKYYWSVMVKMVRDTLKDNGLNYDEKMVHLILKEKTKFYTLDCVEINGKEIYTKNYKTVSFKGEVKETLEYFELVKQWCAENLDLVIPDPQ
jgi:hypothetical protein